MSGPLDSSLALRRPLLLAKLASPGPVTDTCEEGAGLVQGLVKDLQCERSSQLRPHILTPQCSDGWDPHTIVCQQLEL